MPDHTAAVRMARRRERLAALGLQGLTVYLPRDLVARMDAVRRPGESRDSLVATALERLVRGRRR